MAYEPRQLFNFMQGSDISGESAYDIWKRLGNTGSEADFLEFIRTGPQGPKGDPGDSAVSYRLFASDTVIKKDLNGVAVPANVTFGSYYLIGTDVVRHNYSGRFAVQESVNGYSWVTKYTSSEDESAITYTPSSDAALIRCTLYSAGDSAVELDVQSVAILTEVKPNDLEVLSATLTNDAHVVATDGNGENGDYSECITAIQVFSGIRDVTAECTFETNTHDGLTGEWDLDSYTYRVTGLSSDTGYVDIIASYNGITVTKRFSISKTKFGKSAYEIWLEIPGNEGKTEEDFINSTGTGYTDIKVEAAVIESKNYTNDELAKEVTNRNDAIALETAARTAAIAKAISDEEVNRNAAIEAAKGEVNSNAEDLMDSAKAYAKEYADKAVSDAETATGNAITAAKEEVKGYTDEQIEDAKKAINADINPKFEAEETARNTAIETAKGEANDYTDAQIDKAKKDANAYTDAAIGNLIGSAPEIMNTIEEVAAAIEAHQDVTDALNAAIGSKANASDLTDHTDDGDIHITSAERIKWNALEANITEAFNSAIKDAVDDINDAHKTTTDALSKAIEDKANASDLTDHADSDAHITSTERTKWNAVDDKANTSDLTDHTEDGDIHITAAERTKWNAVDDKANASDLTDHTDDSDIHITAAERLVWNAVGDKANASDLTDHTDDSDIHITSAERTAWNAVGDKANASDLTDHTDDSDIHITSAERVKWNAVDDKANTSDLTDHTEDGDIHITAAERLVWNAVSDKANASDLTEHTEDGDIHITSAERLAWNAVGDKANTSDLTEHTEDGDAHITSAERLAWNAAESNANQFTTSAIDTAKGEVNTYTDEQVAAVKNYTDQQIGAIVTNVPEEITVELGTNGTVGGYKTGDVIEAGTELQVILNKLFQKAIPPTYTAPKATVAAKDTASGSYEYGTNITALIQASFTQNDGGALQSISILKDGVEVKTGTTSPLSSDSEDIQLLTTVAYKATASYAEGAVKKNNIGEDWPDGHIEAGSVSSSELKFTPYRQGYFYGVLDTDSSVPLTSDIIRSCNMKNAAYAAGNMPLISASSVANRKRIFVACPATNRGITKVIMPSAMQSDCTNDFVKQATTVTVEGANGSTGIAYNVWVYEPASISDDQTFTVTLG